METSKKFLIAGLIILIIIAAATIIYSHFFTTPKQEIANPLGDIKNSSELNLEDIEISPDYISYLLNQVGAWQLHKNLLTFEKPIINFKIDDKEFSSEIGKIIQTKTGADSKADIQFSTTKQEIVNAILSENQSEYFKQSIQQGKTQIESLAGKTELFAKGYLKLYKELSGE